MGTFMRGDELFIRIEGKPAPHLHSPADVRIMSRSDIHLRGDHNLLNVLAACAISAAVDLPVEAMRAGVVNFHGVPHRLEFVRTWGGAEWYNDSIATAPERSIAALRSFDEPLVLLAGGRDKNLPWEDFAAMVRRRVRHLVLFGEAAEMIEEAICRRGGGMHATASADKDTGIYEFRTADASPLQITRVKGLQEAVQEAARIVQPGDVVLLSPGGTSFDEFVDFEERGEWFKKWVMLL
jgi:UDP-N-acetylmuramoylalanine--D-glutamate ligase